MKNKEKLYLALVITSVVLSFVWILFAVLIIGDKEISEFSHKDHITLGFMIFFECITYIIAFTMASKYNKTKNQGKPPKVNIPASKRQKIYNRRGLIIISTSFILCFVVNIIGVKIGTFIPDSSETVIAGLLVFGLAFPLLTTLFNVIAKRIYIKADKYKDFREFQHYILSLRESVEETARKKEKLLKVLKVIADVCAVLIVICGCLVAFSLGCAKGAGWNEDSTGIHVCVVAAYIIMQGVARIRFPEPGILEDEEIYYLKKEEFQEIYFLAEKAAEKNGCKGNIYIEILTPCNAYVNRDGDDYYIGLGATLLNVLTKEELYTVFLHEFSHVKSDTQKSRKNLSLYGWLRSGANSHFVYNLTPIVYGFIDGVYIFQSEMYLYTISVASEINADKAMAEYGNKECASSTLVKLKYDELFQWEKGTYDVECVCASTKPDKYWLQKEIELFKKTIKEKKDFWNKLIGVEILSRNATHPTLKMRLETLGVTEFTVFDDEQDEVYKEECLRALEKVQELVYDKRIVTYHDERRENYLDPLEIVEKWEKAEKPVKAKEYEEVVDALRSLGRNVEADKLCCDAIEQLSPEDGCYAYYMHGCFLIHKFDDSGIEYMYKSVELDKNYKHVALGMLGQYCCMTGNQAELDRYREKAIEMYSVEN